MGVHAQRFVQQANTEGPKTVLAQRVLLLEQHLNIARRAMRQPI